MYTWSWCGKKQCCCWVKVFRGNEKRLDVKSKKYFFNRKSFASSLLLSLKLNQAEPENSVERKYLSITQTIQCRIFRMNKSMRKIFRYWRRMKKKRERTDRTFEKWVSLGLTNSKMSNNLTFLRHLLLLLYTLINVVRNCGPKSRTLTLILLLTRSQQQPNDDLHAWLINQEIKMKKHID